MTESPDGRPRPTPRPRAGATPRPTPRPRVAGSRREREEAEAAGRSARPAPAPRPATDGRAAAAPPVGTSATARPERSRGTRATGADPAPRRRFPVLVLALALACVVAAAGVAVLVTERLRPSSVDSSIFTAARSGVQALYAYDYKDSEGSVKGKLAVLTGDLHDQYERDLSQGGIIDTYEQVSATTSYEVLDVGLQQVNESQDTAKLVVFGQYVVTSVNSGDQPAPDGSECQVTPEGAQSCTQTVEVGMVKVDGDWKIDEVVLKTTS